MEGRHWRRDGLRENSVTRVDGRPIYSYIIARFASFFVICMSYLTSELNVLPPLYLGLLVTIGIGTTLLPLFIQGQNRITAPPSARASM